MGCNCSNRESKAKKPYNIIKATIDSIKHMTHTGSNPYVDDDTHKSRLKVCLTCDRLNKNLKQCKECGCFVFLKTKYKKSSCPIGLW